jgi:hypothetical protein
MSDEQLAEYKAHSDAYFGKVTRPRKGIKVHMACSSGSDNDCSRFIAYF